jgi:catechol 2,3-dioxygenase-like lactoylglutathione lyase family enzyme
VVTAWVNNVTIDCADADAQAAFYAALLDREIVWNEGAWVVVGRKEPKEPNLVFQRVGDPTPGKARIHLDVHADDVEEATRKAESLGAVRGDDVAEHGMAWRVMRDPEGNPFCIAPGHA